MDAYDDDTYDFVNLWAFVQHWKHYEKVISKDDEALLEQLVDCQNFSIAFELLQMRLKPFSNLLPADIRSMVLYQKKCMKVRDTSHFEYRQRNVVKDYLAPPLTDVDIAELVAAEGESLVSTENTADLIREQDLDYEASLKQDCCEWLPWVPVHEPAIVIAPEPPAESSAITVCVSVAPSGERCVRRFHTNATFQDVAQWVQASHPGVAFAMFTNYPRREWAPATVLSCGPVERKRLLLFAEPK